MTTNTDTTATLTDDQIRDRKVLKLKLMGATWQFIATTCGWGWNGANMDGGRAKRAYLRALKEGANPEEIEVEQELLDELAAIEAEKAAKRAAKKSGKKAAAPAEEEVNTNSLTIFDRIAEKLAEGMSQRAVVNAMEDFGVTLNQVRKVAKAIKEGKELENAA